MRMSSTWPDEYDWPGGRASKTPLRDRTGGATRDVLEIEFEWEMLALTVSEVLEDAEGDGEGGGRVPGRGSVAKGTESGKGLDVKACAGVSLSTGADGVVSGANVDAKEEAGKPSTTGLADNMISSRI